MRDARRRSPRLARLITNPTYHCCLYAPPSPYNSSVLFLRGLSLKAVLLLSSFELIKSIWRSAGNYTEFFTVLDSSLGVAGEIVWLCAGFTRRHVTVS